MNDRYNDCLPCQIIVGLCGAGVAAWVFWLMLGLLVEAMT